jgi:hypothetical protein
MCRDEFALMSRMISAKFRLADGWPIPAFRWPGGGFRTQLNTALRLVILEHAGGPGNAST